MVSAHAARKAEGRVTDIRESKAPPTVLRVPLWARVRVVAMSVGFAALVAGCATPIGVKRISPQDANRTITANVLTTGAPSEAAQEYLERHLKARIPEACAAVHGGHLGEQTALAMSVERLPFVTEAIFICTPHRASFLAENFLGKIARRLVTFPATLTKAGIEMVKLNPGGAAQTAWHLPTAIDNMDWSNPFLKTLAALPIDPRVEAHSIVAVQGDGPPEQGDDGVVKYTSAHIDGVASELIVRDGHSTQATPATIEEVRRILYEHLHAGGAGNAIPEGVERKTQESSTPPGGQ